MPLKSLLALLLLPLAALAAQPWLLPFPDISFDSAHVYFSGTRWTAVYTPSAKTMAIRARDAVKQLPPAVKSSDSVTVDGVRYHAQQNYIVTSVPGAADSVRTLPDPTSEAVGCLTADGQARPDFSNVYETIGPIAGRGNVVWFGLALAERSRNTLDGRPGRLVGGIGWYDRQSNRFGRVYSPALFGFRPSWVGVRQDSAYLLLSKTDAAGAIQSKFMVYDMHASTLVEVNLRRLGIVGDYVESVALWRDTLLLATNQAVTVWKPRRRPETWESRAYQTPETQWLYLKTFPGGAVGPSTAVEFLPFKSNLPLEVKAKVGDWLQMVSPITVEGAVSADDWAKHGALWSQHNWNCGDGLCFARVVVKVKGKEIEADFMNTAFKEVSRHSDEVNVTFRAGWAREEDLVPVMLAP